MNDKQKESKIKSFFKDDKFVVHCGIELVEVRAGYAKSRMNITENHLNAAGVVQGGAVFTIADFTFAAASNAKGMLTVSVTSSIQFFKPPSGAFITAVAREVNFSRKLCTYNVEVLDEDGSFVALFIGTGYIRDIALPFED